MARTYLDDERQYRLNIWDASLAVPNVSTIHDHPWNFRSWIISGELTNTKFIEDIGRESIPVDWMVIKTGINGGAGEKSSATWLLAQPPIVYTQGESYEQQASEIHRTTYLDGTITINDRRKVGDGEHARVFWPTGQTWVDAMPRIANKTELDLLITKANVLL